MDEKYENNEELELEQDEQELEETDEEESEESEEEESGDLQDTLDKLGLSRADYFKLKKGKAKPQTKQVRESSNVDRDELYLVAKGLDDDEIEQALEIARLKKVSAKEAIKDPLFKAYKTVKEQEAKAKSTSLPNSSRGRRQRKEKSLSTPGLTEAERKALWKKQMGQ